MTDLEAAPKTRRHKGTEGVVWILGFVAILHVPSLFNPFVADDYVYLGTAHDLTWSELPGLFTSPTMDTDASSVWWTPDGVLPFYRPMAIVTFALEYRVWGMNPLGYHLTNLALHLLCVLMVSRLAQRVTVERIVSLAAALIFGIHPVHSEAVLWISGRFDVLVSAAVLAGALSYLRWTDSGRSKWPWAVVVIGLYVVSLGSKETGLILPAVLVAVECLRWRGRDAGYDFRSLAVLGSVLGAVAVGYIALRFSIFGGMGELPPPYGVDLSAPTAVFVILRTVAQYILDWVLFLQVEAFYLDGFWAEHIPLLLGCVGVAGLVILWAWRLAGRTLAFRVGVVWAAIFMAPSLMAMPGERNIYLSSAGIALACGAVFGAVWDRARNDASRRRHTRRFAVALASFCAAYAVFDQVVMWGVADVSQTVYDDLMAALPDPPPNARIYVVNQCPLDAGGFIQGVRLHYGRDDILAFALTLAPQFQGTTTDSVYRTGPSTLRIAREGGLFFESFLEKFALFSKPASTMPSSAQRLGLTLESPPKTFDEITEIELTFPGELDDGNTFVFTWDNSRLRSLTDLFERSRWPRLVRCDILDTPVVAAKK